MNVNVIDERRDQRLIEKFSTNMLQSYYKNGFGMMKGRIIGETYCFPNRSDTIYLSVYGKLVRHAHVNTIHDQYKNHSIAYFVRKGSISFHRSSIFVSTCRLW